VQNHTPEDYKCFTSIIALGCDIRKIAAPLSREKSVKNPAFVSPMRGQSSADPTPKGWRKE
jgi:hypothetical protein